MKNYNIAIIDDEEDARRILKKYLERYFPKFYLVGEADSVQSGIQLISEFKPEIILLDIRMNDGTGFDLIDGLSSFIPKIIFTTAYDEYAIKAFKYKAIDYLLKPIDTDSFKESINYLLKESTEESLVKSSQILSEIDDNNKKIAIPTLDGINFLELDTVFYIQADSSYSTIFLNNNQTILVSKPLKFFADKLESIQSGFIRTHKSFLVNSYYIETYQKNNGGGIILKNGKELPISRNRKEEIVDFLSKTNF